MSEEKLCKRCGGDLRLRGTEYRCPTCRNAMDRARAAERKAARSGWSPAHSMTKTVPEGFHVKGVSTLYGADGAVAAQWVKSSKDKDNLDTLMEAIQSIADPLRGEAKPIKSPKVADEDLLVVIPFGDPHFGLHAWHEESGEDFDLKIAERDLVSAMDEMMRVSPHAKQALIISCGDMFHSDSNAGTTTKGTKVDVDSRWPKILSVGIRAMRYCIDAALKKHEHVTFVPVCGNHDAHTSLVLGLCLQAFYEREPRVEIDVQPGRYHYYRFGNCLIGMTHGDTVKKEQLPGIMAFDRKEDWGQTEHRTWVTGHIHHETVKEFPGVTVESFRTLAARDAWNTMSGYRSGRDLRMDVYHRLDGRIDRHIVGIGRLRRSREERDM